MKIKKIADSILGKTAKKKFKSITIWVSMFFIFMMLFYNVSCNILDIFSWKPAGQFNVDLKKGIE